MASWLMSIIPATYKIEIGRIMQDLRRIIVSSLGEKVISTSKLGMVTHSCHPSYAGGLK
jgi:hypothetical protein